MSLVESIKYSGEKAYDIGEKYLSKTHELYSLKLLSYFTSFISEIVNNTLVIIALFISLIFFSIAGFVALAEFFENYITASACFGIFYLIIALLIYLLKERIDNFLLFKISKIIDDNENI